MNPEKVIQTLFDLLSESLKIRTQIFFWIFSVNYSFENVSFEKCLFDISQR